MGEVVELPNSAVEGLRLLYLIPQDRTAWFRYQEEDGGTPTFCLQEDGELIGHHVCNYAPGGIMDNEPLGTDLPERVLAQARRLTKSEFETWDNLRTLDRLHLQLSWKREMLGVAEQGFEQMLDVPFEEGEREHGRWSLMAIEAQVSLMRQLVGEILGLEIAIRSL